MLAFIGVLGNLGCLATYNQHYMRTISALWMVLFFGLLSLTGAAEDLSITPTNTLSFSGLPGGPFIPATWNLTLTNVGAATLIWSNANTANWLSVSTNGGSLAPGDPATTVTVSLTSAANSLTFGNYSANIWFTNLNDNVAQSVPFTLTVDLVQNGGFETGDFTDWTLTGPTDVSNVNFVADATFTYFPADSGIYLAYIGEGDEKLAHLTQTIQTVPGQLYQISFWVNCDDLTPNELLFNWNGQTLFDSSFTNNMFGTNFNAYVWSNFQFTATATSNNTVIDFGAYNDNGYVGLDDVSVQPLVTPPLAFQSVTKSAGSLQLTWNSRSGGVYQLQYNTDLAGANWSNIGNSITATTSTVSTSTAITTDPERFYRIQQLP